PFPAHLRLRDLDAALVANHAAVLHALVLAAQALPVGDRAEDLRAEQPVAFRLERAVVDRLRLGHFGVLPLPEPLGRRQADPDRVEIGGQLTFVEGVGSHWVNEPRQTSNLKLRTMKLRPPRPPPAHSAPARPHPPPAAPARSAPAASSSSARRRG